MKSPLMICDAASLCVCTQACVFISLRIDVCLMIWGYVVCVRGGFLSVDCITLISRHKRRLTTVILSSLVSAKCPLRARVSQRATHTHIRSHLHMQSKPIRSFQFCSPPPPAHLLSTAQCCDISPSNISCQTPPIRISLEAF